MKNLERKKLVNPVNFVLLPEHCEHPDPVSVTVPDESYSIRDLLEKFSRGVDPGVMRSPSYDSDASHESVDLEKLRDSDLVDREEYSSHLSTVIKSQSHELKAIDSAAKQSALDKAKEYDDLVAESKRKRDKKAKGGKTANDDEGTEED